MLYVHCGLPRTGTSSFQAVLSGHRDQLAEAGVVYPDGWRLRNSDAHYGLADLLDPVAAEGKVTIEGFVEYLRANAGGKVLMSNEALSNWLPAERRDHLIDLLSAARQATGVTCLWTLRRADRWATSMYLHLVDTGRPVSPPDEYFLGWASGVADIFEGLRAVEDALGGGTIYSRYEDSGAHYGEMLAAVGVPDPTRAEVEVALRDGPRRNRGLGRSPSAEPAGVGNGSTPGDLVEVEVRRAVHAAALEAAQEVGFGVYAEFFAAEDV
jgi:hypothetical protein